ncbi:hypothetical protein H4582DRAFT_2068008 [Lactarius indigo]|nr:hypothetical protein H4582DRAFT_2068008 [Lactarius indigo]
MPTLREKETTLPEMRTFLERLFDVSPKAIRPDKACHYKLMHVRSVGPTSQATWLFVLDVIATVLSDPSIFDRFFKSTAGLAAQAYALFTLLRPFLSGRTGDLHA